MSNRSLMLFLAVFYLVLTVGLSMGCANHRYQQRVQAEARYVEPARPVAMQRPVVRFEPAPGSRDHASPAPRYADAVPWYAYRNDVRRSVAAGVQSPTLTRTYTRTYDRTSFHNGEPHNSYRRYRFTEEVVESVR